MKAKHCINASIVFRMRYGKYSLDRILKKIRSNHPAWL